MILALVIIGVIVVGFGFTAFLGAPYVPSRRRFITKAFTDLYPVSDRDTVVDIGSGDGIVLRVAAGLGAKAVGYEIHPFFVVLSKILSRRQPNVTVLWQNSWKSRFPDQTTLVYIFSVSRDSKRMTEQLTSEATRLGRPLSVMTYGSELYGIKPMKVLQAYHLYQVTPLQGK